MNLNLSNSGGGNGNYIRFSPQANAWSNQDGEFILEKFVFDIDNVQTGWMLIATGMFEFIPDDSLGRKGAQPSPDHKRGFKVIFYNNKTMGVAEWSANGAGSNMGLEALYKQAVAQRLTNPDKLPVVEYTGSRPEKVGKGSTRVPEFNVTGWVARPAALSDDNTGGFDPEISAPVKKPISRTALEILQEEFKPAPSPIKAKPVFTPARDDDEMFI